MTSERGVLVLSMLAALALGAVALALGLVTGSGAILLDGAFNLCFFATGLVTVRVARLLQRPDDQRYPFGYVQYEPLVNMMKGLLILGVGLLAVIDATLSLSRGGAELSAGIAVGYAAIAVLACGGVLVSLRKAALRLKSPLVDGDVENWFVNAAISMGMLVAFLAAFAMDRLGWAHLARMVDPVLVILVVLLTVAVPLRMARRSLLALLKRGVDEPVVNDIASEIRTATALIAPQDVIVRALRPGRTTYVLAHIVLAEEGRNLTVLEADTIRSAILARLAERFEPFVADIVFTAMPEHAAATTGWSNQPE